MLHRSERLCATGFCLPTHESMMEPDAAEIHRLAAGSSPIVTWRPPCGGRRRRSRPAGSSPAPATQEQLLAFCRERLGSRSPRDIHILDGFPRSAIGKVPKRELAERFSQQEPPAAPPAV